MNERKRMHTVALKAARSAGAYLLKRFEREDMVIRENLTHDVKIDVDGKTETLIMNIIRRRFPGHGFLCEESGSTRGSAGPARSGGYTWVIDPLDGTVNFAKGIPHFCTSIAVKKGETLVAGAVYDPIRRELFSALRPEGTGEGLAPAGLTPSGGGRSLGGAYLNGRPMRTREASCLEDAVVAGGFFKAGSMDVGMSIFSRLSKKVLKGRFFGSAALDLCYLACGRVNAYIQHSVNEWDIAAALLIAELMGKRWEIKRNEGLGTLDVIASDPVIFDELKAIIEASP